MFFCCTVSFASEIVVETEHGLVRGLGFRCCWFVGFSNDVPSPHLSLFLPLPLSFSLSLSLSLSPSLPLPGSLNPKRVEWFGSITPSSTFRLGTRSKKGWCLKKKKPISHKRSLFTKQLKKMLSPIYRESSTAFPAAGNRFCACHVEEIKAQWHSLSAQTSNFCTGSTKT